MSHVTRTPAGELYNDPASGLGYLYFAGGYQLEETAYGTAVSLQGGWELIAAAAVIKGSHPLRGEETRFLRDLLDMPQSRLAKHLGTTRATIARWEAAVTGPRRGLVEDMDLPSWGDTSLRLFAAARLGLSGMSCAPAVMKQKASRKLVIDHDRRGWWVASSTFGEAGGDLAEDPLAHRRMVCTLVDGDYYGGGERTVLARFESGTLEEAWERAAILAAGCQRWFLIDYGEHVLAVNGTENDTFGLG